MNKTPAKYSHQAEQTAQRKKAMIKALKYTLGLVSQAADIAGIGRATHYVWMKEDPLYKLAVDEINEAQMDFVEGKLLQGIKAGQPAMTIFYAKTKMRSRGYQERTEVEHINQPAFIMDKTSEKPVEDLLEVIHKRKGAG